MRLGELVDRIRRGDRAALNEVIRVYGADLYQRALAATQDKTIAQQVTRQMVTEFVDTIKRHPELDGWDLWLSALASRNLEARRSAQREVQKLGDELEREFAAAEVPTYTGSARPQPRAAAESAAAPPPRVYAQPHSPAEPGARAQAYSSAEPGAQARPEPEQKKRGGAGRVLLTLLFSVLCAALLWLVLGMTMRLGWLPPVDLGYAWFNQHIYLLF